MNEQNFASFIKILSGGIIVLLLGGLAGWYFYLHSQVQKTAAVSTGRNLGTAAPTFGAPTGSTQANQALATKSSNSNQQIAGTANYASSTLWEVDKAPVAGMGFVDTLTDEYIYYIERANGYVFSAHPSAHSVLRLTDTLTPKVYNVQFANDGSFVQQALDNGGNVTTFLGSLSASSSVGQSSSTSATRNSSQFRSVDGVFLTPNIRSIAINPTTRSLFYLLGNAHGGVDGFSMQWDGTKKKQVFTSLVGSWNTNVLDDGTIILLESPADGMVGFAYSLKGSGILTPIVRNVPGLTILPKSSSSLVLYGASTGGGLSLFDIATGTPSAIPLATVADKCVWLSGSSEIAYCAVPNTTVSGNFLNGWYKGTVQTSDDWWQIDVATGAIKRVYSPSADNVSIDVENPIIDASGNYITFLNAVDQSLWVLHVSQ